LKYLKKNFCLTKKTKDDNECKKDHKLYSLLFPLPAGRQVLKGVEGDLRGWVYDN